jgi:uncharacterized membrane protein
MTEKMINEHRFNWRLSLYAALGTLGIFLPIALWQSEALFYLFVVIPIVTVFLCLFLIVDGVTGKRGSFRSTLAMLVVFWTISAVLSWNYFAIRTTARWLIHSRDYKSKVLAQPASANGELQHVEWDGWGWAGMDTTAFLVFDPGNSLSPAAQIGKPGKFHGIPCKVASVRRLESAWYVVLLYSDQSWGQCN